MKTFFVKVFFKSILPVITSIGLHIGKIAMQNKAIKGLTAAAMLVFAQPAFAQETAQPSTGTESDSRIKAVGDLCVSLATGYAEDPQKVPFSAVALVCSAAIKGGNPALQNIAIQNLKDIHDTVCLEIAMNYSENPKRVSPQRVVEACRIHQ